jgi:hypothetical protein
MEKTAEVGLYELASLLRVGRVLGVRCAVEAADFKQYN